ncbi:uncharacterized protein LOC144102443 [Amblyomma americanum]
MAAKQLILCAVLAAVLLPGSLGSSQQFIENNPALGVYQDEGKCFPLQDVWYIVYRNFEEDPYFGGDAKCMIITQTSGSHGGTGLFKVEYGGNQVTRVRGTPISSPGYKVKNVVQVESLKDRGVRFNLTSVYTDCSSCKVLRHSYADEGKGCSLWQTKSTISETNSCCDFVFDLVCGTSEKYQIYDDCDATK